MLEGSPVTSSGSTNTEVSTSPVTIGAWFIGARGSVATTATVGLHALAAGLIEPLGVTTATREFTGVPLADFDQIVVGGHDISEVALLKKAEGLADGGMFPSRIVRGVADRLNATDEEIRQAPVGTPTQQEAIDIMARDIAEFRGRHGLSHVVVVDVSSTEPILEDRPEFHDEELLAAALVQPGVTVLPPSSIAAAAAIASGSSYACFTPSAGLALPVLQARAEAAGVAYAGQDGKTGETLLRTVLAPMFTGRAWKVHSWAGANLLGGGDGATLADPNAVRSKLASKTRGLHDMLGDDVTTPLHIDNVPDLGDIKTAWDHISASGFLGSRIVLQTSWTAYDSTLAAPLVIDLVRLLALANSIGTAGKVSELAVFFKDPWGSDVHAFAEQRRILVEWAQSVSAPSTTETGELA
jgi:myo-inositol-1-phosphate synthase